MKNIKRLLPWIPEVYFILFSIWWALETYSVAAANEPFIINYPALLLAATLVLQLYFKNRAVAFILSSLLVVASAYLILALLSDFSRNPTFDRRGVRFLGVGILLIATNITMALLMFHKYYRKVILSEQS